MKKNWQYSKETSWIMAMYPVTKNTIRSEETSFTSKVNFRSEGTFKISSRIVFQRLILPWESSDYAFTHSETGRKWSNLLTFNLSAHPENFWLFKYDLDKEKYIKGISKKVFRKFENAVKLPWKPPKIGFSKGNHILRNMKRLFLILWNLIGPPMMMTCENLSKIEKWIKKRTLVPKNYTIRAPL